jgi:hypothetical protein
MTGDVPSSTDIGGQELMRRIEAAVATQNAGDREGARRLLAGLWRQIGDTGDPLCGAGLPIIWQTYKMIPSRNPREICARSMLPMC